MTGPEIEIPPTCTGVTLPAGVTATDFDGAGTAWLGLADGSIACWPDGGSPQVRETPDAITLCLFDPPDTIGWSDDESGLARLKWSLHQVDDDLLDYGELTDAETAIMLSEGTVEIISGALPLASSLLSGEQYVLKVSISNKAGLHSDEVATPAFGIDESAPVVIDADATFCDHLDYCEAYDTLVSHHDRAKS